MLVTSLTSCSACGHQIAPASRACPQCGQPQRSEGPDLTWLAIATIIASVAGIGLLLFLLGPNTLGDLPGAAVVLLGLSALTVVVLLGVQLTRR